MLQFLLHLDQVLFQFLNQTLANPVFDVFFPFITEEEHFIIPLLIIWFGLMIFGGKRGRIAAILILLATGAADAVAAQLLKPLFGRLRPCHQLEHVRLLVNCGGKFGFVSNHAANMFASMTVLGYFYRSYRWYFWTLAGLIAFSRIYVGVHFPADVLFGGLFGLGIAYVSLVLLLTLNNNLRKSNRLWLEWRDPPPPLFR
ncbi:MAG TPA: phosphatase PAP2 family protein [bacterium]|nr:phosphatase PAP2 family protein [bacterium]